MGFFKGTDVSESETKNKKQSFLKKTGKRIEKAVTRTVKAKGKRINIFKIRLQQSGRSSVTRPELLAHIERQQRELEFQRQLPKQAEKLRMLKRKLREEQSILNQPQMFFN